MAWNIPKELAIYRRERGITHLKSSFHEIYRCCRYINMDFFFFSGLKDMVIKCFVVSYDIACQWYKKFFSWMAEAFPLPWQINTPDVDICFLVPKFHLPAHIEKCQQFFSFNYAKFVGWTDGEAPEHGWSNLNGLAYSTWEMGPGALMCFVRSMHKQTKKTQTMQQRGFICMGPNHKVKLGRNASNQIGTEWCWAKSEIGRVGNRTMLVTTRCVTQASVTMYVWCEAKWGDSSTLPSPTHSAWIWVEW